MGSRSKHGSNAETANIAGATKRAYESSSEQGIQSSSNSVTFLSDEALVSASSQDESTTWERLLNEVARAPAAQEMSRLHDDESTETLIEGSAVGEYSVVRRLSRGTFGTVYQAVHPVIGKEVAVKVLNTRFAADAH